MWLTNQGIVNINMVEMLTTKGQKKKEYELSSTKGRLNKRSGKLVIVFIRPTIVPNRSSGIKSNLKI
jgi:hypothetical protein